MFTLEVVTTYYAVRTYWFAAVAAAAGGLLFKFIWGAYMGYGGGAFTVTPSPLLPLCRSQCPSLASGPRTHLLDTAE